MIDFDALEMIINKHGDILTEQQKRELEKRVFANASKAEKRKFVLIVEMFTKMNEIDQEEEKHNGMDF